MRGLLQAMGADEGAQPPRSQSLPHASVFTIGSAPAAPGEQRWRLSEEGGRVREGRGALPGDLPAGYHRLEYAEHCCLLIACPRRAWLPAPLAGDARWWGAALQLYGLRSRANWGAGDFGDLRRCAAILGDAGAAFLGTNPLHALAPGQASPYSPSSRRFLNAFYLEAGAIDEFDAAALPPGLEELRAATLVDYAGVAAAKRPVLEHLHRRFAVGAGSERRQAFAAFRESQGAALREFALFEALQESMREAGHGCDWRRWPAEYRSPASPAVARFADGHRTALEFFEYLQWNCAQQLARAQAECQAHGMPLGLYADLAVSVDGGGAETWAHPERYALGASIGAPPDEYNRAGQNWGLPPPLPATLPQTGYATLIQTLRANMAHAGALRIDHVMGLERLYWIPAGCDPAEGAYVRYPIEAQLGVLALESVRHRCLVIGEDLGTVPAELRARLAAAAVLSTRLLIFERDAAGEFKPPSAYPRLSLAACSTHDLPTVAGYWKDGGAEREQQAALARALAAAGLADAERALAMHCYLARSAAALVSVQLEDLAGALEQANTPGTSGGANWRRKLPLTLEELATDARLRTTASALAQARAGTPPPEAPAAIPRATYRLQLNRGFTFRDARELLPYLAELGISHLYCSPFLRSRTGSLHGYDVIDHGTLDPEIGSRAEFAALVAALHAQGMGLIMDVVPNHMAIGADNAWWMDVLENGPASPFAGHFDIDWEPASASLENRVLLPVLDDHYGAVLEAGGFALAFERASGTLSVRHGGQRFPLEPGQYARVLERAVALIGTRTPQELQDEYLGIVTALGALPPRGTRSGAQRELIAECKRRLSRLAARPEIGEAIELAAQSFQGRAGEPASFDAMHALLEAQSYRLAYWRVASDEINYRRFFDINELAALRMESDAAFAATHRFVGALLRSGAVDGLRIDHPDGLFDPAAYFRKLQSLAERPLYVVVEKILARGEAIPRDWAIHGLTGYRFAAAVNGLYVDGSAEAAMTRIYRAFTGETRRFAEIAARSKREVLLGAMASELTVLANRLARIAQASRGTRDYTLNTLRQALASVIAVFPVYRTYLADGEPSAQDRRLIEGAVAEAARRARAADPSIYAFVTRALLGESPPNTLAATRHFARKFQQLSAPVMAKGVEDTAFYIYNRLVSLNDVGDDPSQFGCEPAELHRANADRAARWPHSMLATSTHDNKRSEDVRARINVISELPAAWRLQLRRWSALNRAHKRIVDGAEAPSANDEYLLYQTLLGSWPAAAGAAPGAEYRERIERYLLKAIREAKVETSWLNPNPAYEDACAAFVGALLAPRGAFAADMAAAAAAIERPAMLAALSKLMIKLTAPGVPDCYQGNELPDFSLVDPDNRRPVDYALRRRLLAEVIGLWRDGKARNLLATPEDPRAKLLVHWRLLALRREQEALFREAAYLPLQAVGPRAPHLFCFARTLGARSVITVAGRLFAGLLEQGAAHEGWEQTRVAAPFLRDGTVLTDALTGASYSATRGSLEVGEIFAAFPGAVLVCGDGAPAP